MKRKTNFFSFTLTKKREGGGKKKSSTSPCTLEESRETLEESPRSYSHLIRLLTSEYPRRLLRHYQEKQTDRSTRQSREALSQTSWARRVRGWVLRSNVMPARSHLPRISVQHRVLVAPIDSSESRHLERIVTSFSQDLHRRISLSRGKSK